MGVVDRAIYGNKMVDTYCGGSRLGVVDWV